MKRLFGKKHSESDDGVLVLLARFPELWQADMAVSLLASEGIQAYPADELSVSGSDHAPDMGGAGVVVSGIDAKSAWDILQMAERGELSLPEEAAEYTDEWNRQKMEKREAPSRRAELKTRNDFSIRCPRCGSANNEKRKGLKALFSPGYHCKVCHWEWKGNVNSVQ